MRSAGELARPCRMTLAEPAAQASRRLSSGDRPLTIPTANAAVIESPAPLVSTTWNRGETARIAGALGLDPASFGDDDDRLLILRHTLMNPYLIDHENGISYIDRYFDYLAALVRALPR